MKKEKKNLSRLSKVGKKIKDSVITADQFCMKYRVYLFFVLAVLVASIFVFSSNFYKKKQIKNNSEKNDNYFSRRVEVNKPIQFTFEAQYDRLSKIRIDVNRTTSKLSSKDKGTISIYEKDDLNEPIFTKSVYLYSPTHDTIDVDCSNLELSEGTMYYMEFKISSFEPSSVLWLKMHSVNSFSQLGLDEDVQGDIPVGYSYVPNVTYHYASLSYSSLIVHIIPILVFAVLLLFDKFSHNVAFKEFARVFYIPLLLYLMMEILNVARSDGMQFLLPLTWKHFFVLAIAFVVMQILYLLFYGATGRGWIAMLIVTILMLAIGITNNCKIVMRGDSFVPWDIYAAGMAASIGSKYYFRITINFVFGILYAIAIFMLIRVTNTSPRKEKKYRFGMMGTAVALGVAFSFGVLFNKPLLKNMNVSYALYPPLEPYNNNGTLTAFVLNLNNLQAKKGSVDEEVELIDVQEKYADMVDGLRVDTRWSNSVKKPNVICIMSESYGDLRNIRDIETSEPVMPFYDSLLADTIHGKLCVSVFAGGTCNTEFEFLTGESVSGLLAGSSVYTFYVEDEVPWALPNVYRQNGYDTVAIHSFDGEWWDRDETYPLLGFDRFISDDDFEDPHIVRRYISDQSTFERIVQEYENKEEGKPIFEFCVTMQNHADYSQQYDNMAYDIKLQNMEEDFPYTEQYLSLLRESDDALKYLIEYFENVDEPTMIVFFGDHYPTLDNDFYDTILGTELETITAQESLPLYQTPYFVWANYDIRVGSGGLKSPNILGQNILDLSGVESPDERACLRVLASKIGAMNALAVYDRFGTAWLDEESIPEEIQSMIDDYMFLQYEMIYNYDSESDEPD